MVSRDLWIGTKEKEKNKEQINNQWCNCVNLSNHTPLIFFIETENSFWLSWSCLVDLLLNVYVYWVLLVLVIAITQNYSYGLMIVETAFWYAGY